MRRTLILLATAVLALGACSGDDDGARSSTTSEASTTSTTEAGSTPADEGDESTTTGDDPEGSTTTTDPDPDAGGDLAARLPDVEGFEAQPNEDDEGFGDEFCDGSAPSVEPIEEAAADYLPAGDELDLTFAIYGMRYASEDEAGTFYDEFVSTTSGCTDEDITVDEGIDSGIGDEGQQFRLDAGEGGGGEVYASIVGDEIWLLTKFGAGDDGGVIVEAFTTAVG